MNIEDECCCGEPDYGVFGDANQCPRCRGLPLSYQRDPKREAEAARQRKRDDERQRISRDFNSHMIHLYNEARKRP